ncbi:MAG: spore germination protein [Lachnospiraceae bacterium]|nr:spore germination protein [Lachnospiraceae bacterium]
MEQITGNIQTDQGYFHGILCPEKTFDVVERPLIIGGKEAVLYSINGFTDEGSVQRIVQFFCGIAEKDMPATPREFLEGFTPYGDVQTAADTEKLLTALLSGLTILLVDTYREGLIFDCREYPSRGVQEPEKDKVLRGSRDGFAENLVVNTALIRRRIRDPRLRTEIYQVGDRSRTDVAILYMEGGPEEGFLEKIRDRIQKVHVDALTMNQESLAECLYRAPWYNPLPKFRYSERPDTTAACLLENNVVVLVDNSPAAMILPSSVFDIVEEIDDYYFPPLTGTYIRLSRALVALVSLYLTPLYVLVMSYADRLPPALEFLLPAETVNVPILLQLLILELSIDGLRLASVNTPSMLSTPLSIIAGIVLGDFSVKSGWFNTDVMLYMAVVTVANYSHSSFELGYAIKFMRIFLLVMTSVFGIWGFALATAVILVLVARNKTIAGTSYLYPVIPFSWKKIKERLIRKRLPHSYGGNS